MKWAAGRERRRWGEGGSGSVTLMLPALRRASDLQARRLEYGVWMRGHASFMRGMSVPRIREVVMHHAVGAVKGGVAKRRWRWNGRGSLLMTCLQGCNGLHPRFMRGGKLLDALLG